MREEDGKAWIRDGLFACPQLLAGSLLARQHVKAAEESLAQEGFAQEGLAAGKGFQALLPCPRVYQPLE